MKSLSTSDQIAGVALKILEKKGAAAVSMRRVAKAVGITPMAIYHHFPNRKALLQSIVDHEFSKVLDAMNTVTAHRSHELALLHSFDAYIHYSFTHPRIFDYIFSEAREGARRYPEDFRAGRSPTLSRLADLVSAAMKDGFMRPGDIWEVAFGLWAHVHGYVMLYRGGRINLSEAEFHALVHRSFKQFLHGLKK